MHCSELSYLELNGNPLGSIGMQELAKVVERSTCIQCISVLGCTVIGNGGTTQLLQALSKNQSVQAIFLPEELCTTAYSHLASRAVWLPDIATDRVVDLSNSFIPMELGKLLQFKYPCKHVCRLTWPAVCGPSALATFPTCYHYDPLLVCTMLSRALSCDNIEVMCSQTLSLCMLVWYGLGMSLTVATTRRLIEVASYV